MEQKNEKTMRDKMRGMKPGVPLVIHFDKRRQIASIKACASYLNNDEPELGLRFVCDPNRADKLVVITATRVEQE